MDTQDARKLLQVVNTGYDKTPGSLPNNSINTICKKNTPILSEV